MANFYLDLVSGNDSNDGLGPYKAAFTSGGTYTVVVGDTLTGATSGRTAKVVYVAHTSGTWAGGDEAGTFYVGTPSGAFSAGENLNVGANNNVATLTADFAVSSWLTIAGGTAAKIGPADEIRIKKHADPASQSTHMALTVNNATAVLDDVKWLLVDNAENAWTSGDAAITTTRDGTIKKSGSYGSKNVITAPYTGPGIVSYYDFGAGNEKNLSGYTNISIAFYTGTDIAGGLFRLDLCSGANGTTPVNSLTITQKTNYDIGYSGWNTIILRNGSALGSSIRSIAIYALSDPGAITVGWDEIYACNAIHPLSIVGYNDEWWYVVSALSSDGVTMTLSGKAKATDHATCYAITEHQGFDGATSSSVIFNTTQDNGTAGNTIKYRGGWDFLTDAQTGYTNMMSVKDGCGVMISVTKAFNRFERLRFGNCSIGISGVSGTRIELKDIFASCAYEGIAGDAASSFSSIEGIINLSGCRGNHIAASYDCFIATAVFYLTGMTGSGTANISFWGYAGGSILGTIYSYNNSNGAVCFEAGKWFVKAVYANTGIFFPAGLGDVIIEYAETSYSGALQVFYHASSGSAGTMRIAQLYNPEGQVWNVVVNGNYYPCTRFTVDSYRGDSTIFKGCSLNGVWGDHVSMGQAANWAYGGTGKSILFSPSYTPSIQALLYEFFIPASASKNYKLSMQVRKTSSGANPTLKYSVSGCGITMVVDESVTLTDSWAEHLTATAFATTIAGMLRVELKMNDGSTTGDIGIDAIKLTEV
jgi:hypothetical protein